ncbi:MAG: hypothetical protein PWQ57_669 [Desulfovibrionales bacterium]|jgi:hypothetical protein|nr:hypothetical protein [Desulfovibrionales bacterium]
MKQAARIIQRLDKALYRRGFRLEAIRQLVRNQILLALLSALAFFAAAGISKASLGFFAGAAIVTLNFYALALVAPGLVHLAKGAVAPLLFQFYGRLILTGILLYLLIAWLHVSIIALLAGLSTVMVNALLWAALFYIIGRKVKEA